MSDTGSPAEASTVPRLVSLVAVLYAVMYAALALLDVVGVSGVAVSAVLVTATLVGIFLFCRLVLAVETIADKM